MFPHADHGHQALAELLAGVIRTAARNVAAAGGPAAVLDGISSSGGGGGGQAQQAQQQAQQQGQQAVLPPPMIPGNADQATTLCAMQARGLARVGFGARWRSCFLIERCEAPCGIAARARARTAHRVAFPAWQLACQFSKRNCIPGAQFDAGGVREMQGFAWKVFSNPQNCK